MNHLPRLLLLEDSPFRRYIFGRLLRLKGYEVREAADEADAMESLQSFPADLVLTDMQGDVLISQIRSNPDTANLAVLPLTDRTGDNKKTDPDMMVSRPVDLPGLLERLRSFVPAAAI